MRMAFRHAFLMTVSALLVLAPVAAADDDDDKHTHTLTFDHKTGNGWWVEVYVSPLADKVQARDTNGPWVNLQFNPGHGNSYGASFPIERGNDVQFRALVHDAWIESCWFEHPSGVTQDGQATCSASEKHKHDGKDDDDKDGKYHVMTFDHKTGNGWWVEAYVTGGADRVQARDTDGSWVEMQYRPEWGSWAASFRIEPGHEVQFRALDHGEWHTSCWFDHPSGEGKDGQVCKVKDKDD